MKSHPFVSPGVDSEEPWACASCGGQEAFAAHREPYGVEVDPSTGKRAANVPEDEVWHKYTVTHRLTGAGKDYPNEEAALDALRRLGKEYEMKHYTWVAVESTVLA